MEALASLIDPLSRAWSDLPLGQFQRRFLVALGIGAGLFVVIYAIERCYGQAGRQYRGRGVLHDIAYWFYYRSGFHNFLFMAGIFAWLAGPLAVFDLGLTRSLPIALQALAYLLVVDLVGYWIHRAQHQFRFLWAFHSTHHSQPELSFLTSIRHHPVDMTIQALLLYIPLRMLGFGEMSWLPVYVLGELSANLQHSRIPWRFGPLYGVFVSPGFHAYHHSTDPAHHHRHFAGIFSFWDSIFGTAVPRNAPAPREFGLAGHAPSSLGDTLIRPFTMLGSVEAGSPRQLDVRH